MGTSVLDLALRMKTILLFGVLALASASVDPLSQDFIDKINAEGSTWKAGRNFPLGTPKSYLRRLNGVLPGPKGPKYNRRTVNIPEGFEIPENFDAREQWPDCPTIKEIRDQGSCGSCWAVGAVSVMSDRACIHSEGKANFRYSSDNLVSCCHSCGFGCNGGWLGPAFEYWISEGIVSGGRYNSNEGCQPYSIPECGHHVEGDRPDCSSMESDTPPCRSTCIPEYDTEYESDLRHGSTSYSFYMDVDAMQHDLMTNGPLEASFDVYADFYSYKSGVYQHVSGDYLGGHAIRVIGWGVENGTPYWLMANSWNTDWGDNGTFKILRGKDECSIESDVHGGIPADI